MSLKKQILAGGLILIILLIVLLGIKVKSSLDSLEGIYRSVFNNRPEEFDRNYLSWQKQQRFWNKTILFVDKISFGLLDKKFPVKKYLSLAGELTQELPNMVGKNGQRTYYLLFQNNMELRPTGGFLGSYAKVKFENGGMKDFIVQDIYVPDGQIEGHVEPPLPIQQAFKQGWFRLRDANWDPDFPASAQTIAWFMEKGKEDKADGIIAINLFLTKDLLDISGSLFLIDYNLTVNQQNFYQIAQENSETDFFPGSTQKSNIMSSLSKSLITKLLSAENKDIYKIAKILQKNLDEKQILVYLAKPEEGKIFHSLNWDGALKKRTVNEESINDYLYIVEANLGVNKANNFVTRAVEQDINIESNNIVRNKVKINYQNTSKYTTPIKPVFWGGSYLNYLRIYYPLEASEIVVKVGGKVVDIKNLIFNEHKDRGLSEIGFWVTVPALSEEKVELSYNLVENNVSNKKYYLSSVQKQSGIEKIPFNLTIKKDSQLIYSFDEELVKDWEIKVKI